MRVNLRLWLVPVFLTCLVLGVWRSDVIAAEDIKAPLLTGITWVKMSQDQKAAYIWGAGDVVDLEQEIMEIHPELKRESFVTKAVEKLMSSFSGEKTISNKGTLLIATVKGDVHDIGKNLVTLIMTASGYEVIDLGTDVSAEVIVDKVTTLNPQMIGLSSLLSTTMPVQR